MLQNGGAMCRSTVADELTSPLSTEAKRIAADQAKTAKLRAMREARDAGEAARRLISEALISKRSSPTRTAKGTVELRR
jgi:hypothetical protein